MIGGVRDFTSAIISHEKTQSNPVCCFQLQTLDVVFPNDLFSDYIEITIDVVVPCGGSRYSVVMLTFSGPL